MKRGGRLIAVLLTLSLLLGTGWPALTQAAVRQHPFADIVGSKYETVVATLWDYGVVSGLEPNKFIPDGPVTRAQMAALIVRAMGKADDANMLSTVPSEFSDVPNNHWARGVITLANRAGIIKGDTTGQFYPNDPVNYAQAATMLVRALGYEGDVVGGYPSGYVLKANELGLFKDAAYELYGGVNRAEAAVLLYNAIFRAPTRSNGLTWSQSVFKRPAKIELGNLPMYVASGQRVPLSATAQDVVGQTLADAVIQYSVVGGNGQIQGNALVVGEGGLIKVRAALGDLTAEATVTPVTQLTIEPPTFEANKGGTIQLTAFAMSGSQRVAVQPTWSVNGPATISEEGTLRINDYGAVTVEAKLGSLTAVVAGQAVGKITIGDAPEYLVPGITYKLTATAKDPSNRPVSVPITWTAIGATIDRTTGQLTNPTGSTVTVRATAAGITEEVKIPVLKSLVITPASATLLRGRTAQFTVKGRDASGKEYDVDARWDRSNPAVGVVNSSGTFAGTSSGSSDVTATLGSLQAKAQVRVSGEPARLSVTAASSSLPSGTGASTTVTIRLLDKDGNLSPVSEQPIVLTLNDSGRGSLSNSLGFTDQGVATVNYTAGATSGSATITVSAPSTTMTNQTVTIRTYQPTPAYVQLTATPQPLAVGGGVATITATLRDSSNVEAVSQQSTYVTLTAAGSSVGGLTGTTILIPAGQTSGSTSFISSNAPGTVQINGSSTLPVRGIALKTVEAGPAAKINIRPVASATPVTGLSSLTVQVEVQDEQGVVRANDNTTEVILEVAMEEGSLTTGPHIYTSTVVGGVARFMVPAYTVGTATLTATLADDDSISDTATARFVPGVFSKLRLTAIPANIPADGYTQSQVVAEVVDQSGNVMTTVNPLVTFRKLVDGQASTPLSDLTVQAVGGRAVLPVSSTRIVGVDTWYATADGFETQNIVTVSTAGAVGSAHALRVDSGTDFAVGETYTITVEVVDDNGRVVTSDSGRTIIATESMSGVTISPSTATTDDGVATFEITSTRETSGTITFTTTGLTNNRVSEPVSFGGETQSDEAYSLYASSSASRVKYTSSITLTVRVMDDLGNLVSTDDGRTITARLDNSSKFHLNKTSGVTSDGYVTFTLTATMPGRVTVTFTGSGLSQPTTSLTLEFTN